MAMRVAAVAVVAGAVGLGGLALVSPAVAGTLAHPFVAASNAPGGGYGPGGGGGMGYGMRGNGQGAGMRGGGMGAGGMGAGGCAGLTITAERGTLTDAQRTALAGLAQEEKLAHDLYAAFAGKSEAVVFDHIAAAETQHLNALRTLMDRYGVTDPTKGVAAGTFSDPGVQATYDRLLKAGSASDKAAFEAGRTVEQADIDALTRALDGLSAPDAKQVYTFLKDASQRHLTAFGRWAGR